MTRAAGVVWALVVACGALAAPAVRADDPAPSPAPPSTPPPSTPPSTEPPAPAADQPAPDAAAGAPAALEGEPAAKPAATPAQPAAKPAASVAATPHEHRVGDPIPLTRREPTLHALQFMVGVRYGLVGTGPTRFVDDIRFGITDHIELRTDLVPYPASLMVRGRIGSSQSGIGAVILEGGLAHWDAGVRIVPDTGESAVGMRFHFEGGVGWLRALGDKLAVGGQAHYRYRLSLLPDDDEHAIAVSAFVAYDLLDSLAVGAGVGFASTLGTPVRELSITFVETDAPGISYLLARDDGVTQSLTIPLTMTYGRVEDFDVDLFCTPRVWPQLGILFGAGVRLRFDPFS